MDKPAWTSALVDTPCVCPEVQSMHTASTADDKRAAAITARIHKDLTIMSHGGRDIVSFAPGEVEVRSFEYWRNVVDTWLARHNDKNRVYTVRAFPYGSYPWMHIITEENGVVRRTMESTSGAHTYPRANNGDSRYLRPLNTYVDDWTSHAPTAVPTTRSPVHQ